MNKRKDKIQFVNFHSCRNVTSPDDKQDDRKSYSLKILISDIVHIPTDKNVRNSLLVTPDGRNRRMSAIHRDILETLETSPANFSVLNGGITCLATDIEIRENQKTVMLTNPSIINGAQTQAVIIQFLKDNPEFNPREEKAYVKLELIITKDDDLSTAITLTRNSQNKVKQLSIAGRQGAFDELEKRFRREDKSIQLMKSESDKGAEFIETEKIVQVLTLLIPEQLYPYSGNKSNPYRSKQKALKQFVDIFVAAKDPSNTNHKAAKETYAFFLDIAFPAYSLYQEWRKSELFVGHRLRRLKRDRNNKFISVPDGYLFPFLCGLSAFLEKDGRRWIYNPPENYNFEKLVEKACRIFKKEGENNPTICGKMSSIYSQIYIITSTYIELRKEILVA